MQGFKKIIVQGVELQVSRSGRVCYCGKEWPTRKCGNYSVFYAGGKKFLVHRLVAQAWLNKGAELPKGCEVHHINNVSTDNRMSKPVMYAVVDYPIDSKDEVASAFFRTSLSAEMAICESYEEARDAATDFLADGSDEIAIIPIALDVDNVECVYSEMIVKTVKLKK